MLGILWQSSGFTAEGVGSISGQEMKILQAVWRGQKKKKKQVSSRTPNIPQLMDRDNITTKKYSHL